MKRLLLIYLFSIIVSTAFSQQRLPDVTVFTPSGTPYTISDCVKDSIPVVISFWATFCKPCIRELNAIYDVYPDWQDEIEFKIIAISLDDSRSSSKVEPMVKGFGWPYQIFIDSNETLKHSMNILSIPSVFVLDRKGNIIHSHIGYTFGSEDTIFDVLKSAQ